MYQLYGEGGAWIPNKPINRGLLAGYHMTGGNKMCLNVFYVHFNTFMCIYVQVLVAKGLCAGSACYLHLNRSKLLFRRGFKDCGAGFAKLYCLEDADGNVLRDAAKTL